MKIKAKKSLGQNFLIDKNDCEQWEKRSKKSVAYHLANRINDLLINHNKRAVNA